MKPLSLRACCPLLRAFSKETRFPSFAAACRDAMYRVRTFMDKKRRFGRRKMSVMMKK